MSYLGRMYLCSVCTYIQYVRCGLLPACSYLGVTVRDSVNTVVMCSHAVLYTGTAHVVIVKELKWELAGYSSGFWEIC